MYDMNAFMADTSRRPGKYNKNNYYPKKILSVLEYFYKFAMYIIIIKS